MTAIRADLLDMLSSSRLPLSVAEMVQDLANWPLSRGERRRVGLTVEGVQLEVNELVDSGEVDAVDGGYKLHREVAKVETQRSLF